MNIELRIIDKENMYDVIELEVADEQKDFVASNSFRCYRLIMKRICILLPYIEIMN